MKVSTWNKWKKKVIYSNIIFFCVCGNIYTSARLSQHIHSSRLWSSAKHYMCGGSGLVAWPSNGGTSPCFPCGRCRALGIFSTPWIEQTTRDLLFASSDASRRIFSRALLCRGLQWWIKYLWIRIYELAQLAK